MSEVPRAMNMIDVEADMAVDPVAALMAVKPGSTNTDSSYQNR